MRYMFALSNYHHLASGAAVLPWAGRLILAIVVLSGAVLLGVVSLVLKGWNWVSSGKEAKASKLAFRGFVGLSVFGLFPLISLAF